MTFTGRLSQFEGNLASLTLQLSAEQVKALDAASSIEPGFPQRFFDRDMIRAFVYGGLRDRILT